MTNDSLQVAPNTGTGGFSFSKAYRRYVLFMLTFIYFINFVDRQILAVLVESIKADLHITDGQVGLLTGIVFALFYTFFAIPIAWAADRYSRRNVLIASLTLWSIMTAACGLAKTFPALLAARIGVGIGEAGASPPAHSMISDYFSGKERNTALGIFACGAPLAVLVGYALGDKLNQLVGWRETFIIVGLPGILIGIIALLTVKEPPRGHADGVADTGEKPNILKTFRYLITLRTFWFVCAAISLQGFVSYSLMFWMPSFFERTHGLMKGEIGLPLGLSAVIGGILGMLPGSFLADKLAARDLRWYCWLGAIGLAVAVPPLAYLLTTSNHMHAYIAFGMAIGLVNICVPSSFTILQGIAPLRMRASATALFFLIINLVGIGGGPTFVGYCSDFFASAHGSDSLRMALLAIIPLPFVAAIFFLCASRLVNRDFLTPHPGKRNT